MHSPTRVRYSVLFMLCLLAMITYMDRAMYGKAQKNLMDAVGQPVENFFYVLTAFQLAYALFEIPAGWLGDRFGPRFALLRVVLWWSFFVAVTGCAGLKLPGTEIVLITFTVLIFTEFCFGVGEAGAFPNISKAIYNWFPPTQRGFAKGAIWTSARFMGGLTPLIWVLIVEIGGRSWREALFFFTGIAVTWCAAFAFWFRNKPDEHPSVNDAERRLILGDRPADFADHSPTPWKKIFSNRNMIALCAMYMVTNFNWYFLMYYLPGAFKSEFPSWEADNAGKIKLALLGGSPLLVGMLGCWIGGAASDRLIRRLDSRKWGRRIVPMFGYGMAGICYLLASAFIGDLALFAACLMFVGFFNDLIMGPAWAASQDIGGRHAAVVGGAMNMIGNLGAVLGIVVTGNILKAYTVSNVVGTNGFIFCFIVYGGVYFLGVIAWLFIDASKPIVPENQDA
jgi:MFS family permease